MNKKNRTHFEGFKKMANPVEVTQDKNMLV